MNQWKQPEDLEYIPIIPLCEFLAHTVRFDGNQGGEEYYKHPALNWYVTLSKHFKNTSQWIKCTDRMPPEPFGCLATVWDSKPLGGDDFENILPYFVGWDGEQWNDENGEKCPFEVIAWMPLPKPYKEEQSCQE